MTDQEKIKDLQAEIKKLGCEIFNRDIEISHLETELKEIRKSFYQNLKKLPYSPELKDLCFELEKEIHK